MDGKPRAAGAQQMRQEIALDGLPMVARLLLLVVVYGHDPLEGFEQ